MKKALILVLILNFSSAFSQGKFYSPTIEISDYTLSKFITELTLAVGKKDKNWILNHVSLHFQGGYGDYQGVDEFKKFWNLDNPNSDFWKITERLLILGGSKYKEGSNKYYIPFTFRNWPVYNYQPESQVFIAGTKVNIRNEPNITTSKILGELNYEIVNLSTSKSHVARTQYQEIEPNYNNGPSWYYVCTLNKEICGFVYWKYVLSIGDYRMGFIKSEDQWGIWFLVDGQY